MQQQKHNSKRESDESRKLKSKRNEPRKLKRESLGRYRERRRYNTTWKFNGIADNLSRSFTKKKIKHQRIVKGILEERMEGEKESFSASETETEHSEKFVMYQESSK